MAWSRLRSFNPANWESMTGVPSDSQNAARSTSIFGFMVGAGALLIGVGLLMWKGGNPAEIQMGLMIVLAVTALMTLLFVVAGAFARLNLTNRNQALGLPEGSIRAMIALILIMVFIILSIYVFRTVGEGRRVGPIVMTVEQMQEVENIDFIRQRFDENGNPFNQYDVWLYREITPDGIRLAQQLATVVGTLAVAVAGFYFGSSAVSGGIAATRDFGQIGTAPRVDSITPSSTAQNAGATAFEIAGMNFRMPSAVVLTRSAGSGVQQMLATGAIMSSSDRITCSITIDTGNAGDSFDVVVTNADGTSGRRPGGFTLT